MNIPFILMTIAFAISQIVVFRQRSEIKELREKYDDLYNKGWREYTGFSGKRYRSIYKYIVIENAGDNLKLNNTVRVYQNEGYDIDIHQSTDRLLVFVKNVEVKPGFKD